MATSPFDSAIYRDLFSDAEVGKLFSDSAEIRAMILVQGALAKVQGALGVIPSESADFIHRSSFEIQIDPGALAAETGQNAVVVPALVKAFRAEMQAPDHAQYAHWGATSQDIMDTGLVLRLRQTIGIFETRLRVLIKSLGLMADTHSDLPLAARTLTQIATPTSFGAVVAAWGEPLLTHLDRLDALKPRLLCVSLSGANGTLSAMGEKGPEVRAELAKALALADPKRTWHTTRDTMAEFAAWMTLVGETLAKMGEDLILLNQSGFNEVTLGAGGGSSTMPQKSNPVQPSLLLALGRQMVVLNSALQGAAIHRQQRDSTAWMLEWLNLPQMCMATARSLTIAGELAEKLQPNPEKMNAQIDDGLGLIYAEALSFALTKHMSRPEAQAAIKSLCKQAIAESQSLAQITAAKWPDYDLSYVFHPAAQLGTAPIEARNFANAAKII